MDILTEAQKEFNEELRREAINAEKVKLREKRKSLWSRFVKTLKTKKIVIKLENKNV